MNELIAEYLIDAGYNTTMSGGLICIQVAYDRLCYINSSHGFVSMSAIYHQTPNRHKDIPLLDSIATFDLIDPHCFEKVKSTIEKWKA